MRIPLVGGLEQERSIPLNASRTINFIPVTDKDGREALYGTPGLEEFSECGSGPVRAEYAAANGRAFVVSGPELYEIDSDGNETVLGYLDTFTGPCSMDENGQQLAVCDGADIYILTYEVAADIVTNGGFGTDTGWTKGAGWTISAGVATATGDISTALSQTASETILEGRTYTLSYDVTQSAGSITPAIGGTSGTARSASGSYSETIVAGSTQLIAFTGAGFSGTIDNVTLTPLQFEKVTTASKPDLGAISFIDGYFVGNKVPDSGQFHISALYNGFKWAALDFASAESSPDFLKRAINALGQLFLMGDKTGEVFTNTGDSSFPFQRISGAKMETGIAGALTAISYGGYLLWVGKDAFGSFTVYRASSFSPERISTHAVEYRLQTQVTDESTLVGWLYQQDGRVFYVLTGGGLETSLCIDLTTGYWHERMFLGEGGEFEQHLGSCCMFAFGHTLVGSRIDGKIYRMAMDIYSDDGREILSERTTQHILSDDNKRTRLNSLDLLIETGVGNADDIDPVVMMRMSKDGGRNWSAWLSAAMGRVGEYMTSAVFRRLGVADQVTFQIRITSKVKKAIFGAYLE